MRRYIAYIRVSTVRQGEKGASLPEQKAVIESYAKREGLFACVVARRYYADLWRQAKTTDSAYVHRPKVLVQRFSDIRTSGLLPMEWKAVFDQRNRYVPSPLRI